MLGSPPQMRGKRVCRRNRHIKSGITPAGAGKTFVNSFILPISWDHPRRCGENEDRITEESAKSGSPPQVRGKLSGEISRQKPHRITPAGAGKTSTASRNPIGTWDHPRRCGENALVTYMNLTSIGSPPQVRGKLSDKQHSCRKAGITPAGAGKTVLYINFACGARDHPRRCGENIKDNRGVKHLAGSPPQVRGKPRKV